MKHYIFIAIAAALGAGSALAADSDYVKAVLGLVTDRNPETHVAAVDKDRLVVHRIDVVDSKGDIRLTLAGDLPNPIVDGVEYKRSRPTGGLIIRDDKGNERGGIAYTPGFGLVIGLDHSNAEAAGFNVQDDGTVHLTMAKRPEQLRLAELGNRLLPGYDGEPISASVSPNGTPELALNDKQNKPRVVITLTAEGYGAIKFLDASGKTIQTLVPEHAAKTH